MRLALGKRTKIGRQLDALLEEAEVDQQRASEMFAAQQQTQQEGYYFSFNLLLLLLLWLWLLYYNLL